MHGDAMTQVLFAALFRLVVVVVVVAVSKTGGRKRALEYAEAEKREMQERV